MTYLITLMRRVLILFLFLFLTACGGENAGSSTVDTTDTDGDGLTDVDEINKFGTSPVLADTDADGFDDFKEVVTLGFDPAVNNLRFNPLIADLPQISVEITSVPDISLNYTETNGTTTTLSTNRSQSSSTSLTKSKTSERSNSFSHSHSFGIDGFKFKQDNTIEFTTSSSTSWTNEHTTENTSTLDQGEAFEESRELSAGDGSLAVTVEIVNTGHLTYSLQNLFLSATYYDPAKNNPLTPVGNLPFDSKNGGFPNFSLAPGQKTGPLNFAATDLKLNTMKGLLRDSRGLSIRPAIFDLLDADGTPFNFNNTGIDAQTAMVVIDFGGAGGHRDITARIAVNGNPDDAISVDAMLRNVLKLTLETTEANGNMGIIALSGIANIDPTRLWVMIHAVQEGNGEIVTTIYTTPQDKARLLAANPNIRNLATNFDITQIRLHGDDILHLIYLEDDDLDGLGNRQEFFNGSDPQNPDTDGDGLTDGAEVKGWQVAYTDESGNVATLNINSSPRKTDTDGDGLNDAAEANVTEASNLRHRNPRNPDTDGDGIPDLTDDFDEAAGLFLDNGFDPIAVTSVGVVVSNAVTGEVTVNYTVRDVTGTGVANSPGNGISDYRVIIFRQKTTGNGFAGSTPSPISGLLPIVGDTFPCDNGFILNLCSWTVAHIGGLLPAPGIYNFVDPETLTNTTSFRYITFVRINGEYREVPGILSASLATETLEIHVLPGKIYNRQTGAQETDGQFNLTWGLYVNGVLLRSNGKTGMVGPIRIISHSNQPAGPPRVSPLTTEYDEPVIASGRDTFADSSRYEISPVTGGSVFRVVVPEQANCYFVDLIVREYDHHPRWRQYSNVRYPQVRRPKHNIDQLKLCREAGANGIWTATPRKVNPDQPDLGSPSLSRTRVNNTGPIDYKTRTLIWDLSNSPTRGELVVPYKVFVKP